MSCDLNGGQIYIYLSASKPFTILEFGFYIGLMFNMFNKYKHVINIFQIQVYIYLYVLAGSFVSFADILYFVVDR